MANKKRMLQLDARYILLLFICLFTIIPLYRYISSPFWAFRDYDKSPNAFEDSHQLIEFNVERSFNLKAAVEFLTAGGFFCEKEPVTNRRIDKLFSKRKVYRCRYFVGISTLSTWFVWIVVDSEEKIASVKSEIVGP